MRLQNAKGDAAIDPGFVIVGVDVDCSIKGFDGIFSFAQTAEYHTLVQPCFGISRIAFYHRFKGAEGFFIFALFF